MIKNISPVSTLLIAIFMIMAGSGFLAPLLSLRLDAAGVSPLLIGFLTTAYFTGLMIGSLTVSRVIERVGHIRAFTAFVSLFSATALTYAIHLDPTLWSLIRFIEGFCMAGVFVCLESWLNERAPHESRGAVLAYYMIALYAGQAAGQFFLNLNGSLASVPLIAASVLLSLAILPVALTRLPAPALSEGGSMHIRELYRVSPLGVAGAVATGMMLGAFYGLGAVFALGVGLKLAGIALFMSATITGGVALQWPLGWLSDLFDRRLVIVWTIVATLAICVLIVTAVEGRYAVMASGAFFGGVSFALYPLCVAHTNDHLSPEQRVSASGGLVLAYSLGAIAGPMAGVAFMSVFGPRGLFVFIGFCAAAVLGFAIWRLKVAAPIPAAQQNPYQILPRTTPVVAVMDPLATDS
ncbi:MAG: MFS transporter [Alphaproteobacteria bacterium]|nr:MFS transporter [Alphaproteobacteria bacterium]